MIYLIRHANCQANVDLVWKGVSESPLTKLGYEQLKHLKHFFKSRDIDLILSSPLLRAQETALAIQQSQVERLNRPKIELRNDLLEFNGGVWEGMSNDDLLKRADYGLFCSNIEQCKAEGGESFEDIRKRAVYVASLIKNTKKNIAIVSHGVFIRTLNAILQNTSVKDQPWTDNCSITMYSSDLTLVKKTFCSFIPEEFQGFNQSKWSSQTTK